MLTRKSKRLTNAKGSLKDRREVLVGAVED